MTYTRTQSGFSLIETLVAISLLLIVIVGPMTIVSNVANSTTFSNEQVTAFLLAQEGIELAQKGRDDIILTRFRENSPCPEPWDAFVSSLDNPFQTDPPNDPECDDVDNRPFGNCFSNNGCALEVDQNTGRVETPTVDCTASGASCFLYLDTSDDIRARYTYDTTNGATPLEQTPYKRRVFFDEINNHEIRVRSEVEWFPGNTRDPQTVVAETYLFDIFDPSL